MQKLTSLILLIIFINQILIQNFYIDSKPDTLLSELNTDSEKENKEEDNIKKDIFALLGTEKLILNDFSDNNNNIFSFSNKIYLSPILNFNYPPPELNTQITQILYSLFFPIFNFVKSSRCVYFIKINIE